MEGAGEGMVAIVQALQDAGLSVTLTNPAVGHEHVRRSQAYNGMSNVLKWNGHVSRAMNSQTEGYRQCQAHGGGMRNGVNNSYQLPHGSKSTGSPLNRHLDASPYSFRQLSNENSFVANCSNDFVTQTPARRESLSTRSSAYWSQRAMPSARSARAMDAFADSLRKYPCISPERSTSADLIQRLINYTQAKNLTKSSYHSKSLRSLRNIEPNDSNISKKKSTKNIQTYTRKESPARETSPCSQELRFNDRKRSPHTPRSDSVRCRDSALSTTYDYLKGISSRGSPPRGTEVRYLQDVTRYVKDTLKQICDEQTTTCPNIASRYSQHKRDCPKKMGRSSSESVNKQIQTSTTWSREASTVTQGEDSYSKLHPKACNSCHRPLPRFSKSSSFRKIRFSTTDPCPRYITREVVPKPECPENDPCPCSDPDEEFRNKLKQHVLEWLKEIPVNIKYCSLDKKGRTKIVMDLVDKLMALRGVDNCEDRMRKYIFDCLEKLPMWLPCGTRAQEVFKNELADDLINNRLLDLFNTRDTIDETIAKWVEGLNFDDDGELVNKGKVVQNFIKRLKPLNQYRTDDNDLFRDDLKENIIDMLEKLPLQIEGSNIKYYNEKADILADELAGLPKLKSDEKDLYKKLINNLLKNVDKVKGLKPSERKRIVEQLSGNVKDLITRDMNDDDRQEIIRKVVDDWIGSTHADPDDLISYLRKKILDWLHNKPEFFGDSLSIVQDNEELSKNLAKKFNDVLPELLEDDNVKNQLLEDINDQLKDTLEMRGDQIEPKTTEKLAKDLLNYLVDTVKESQKNTLEQDLIKIVQDELKKTPQLSGDTPSSKRDNDNLSRDIAKKFLQVPSKNLDNKDVKDNLTEDINDQLNEALDNRGQREAPKAMQKLTDNLFDKLKNAIQNEKEGNLLENVLRKKILESLNEVPELAGVSSATNRANDKFSKDLATKMLEVPPEYIDNEDVIEHLLEDINDQLNEALEKRGQRKDPKETKELAKDMLNELVGAIKRGKSSRKGSSRVSDPLENKLRQKVLEYLNDVPDFSGNTPSNKMYNDKISKTIAKKTKDSLPQLLEDDDVKNQLLEDIHDQLKHTLKDRGIDKSPKTTKKLAKDLLNYLGDTVKESQKNTLEKDLIKIVQDELKKTPQLSGDTPSSKRDNDNLSRDIAKKFLQVPSKNLDNKDVKDNLTEDINDQLNEALDNRGQREAPKVVKKLADNLFDKLKDAIQNEKEGNLLENVLRKKILESLNEVPELAGVSSATNRANDKFSKDLATKMLEVPPEYIDNEDVIDNLLEDINDQLNEALEKRGQRKDPKETEELAKDMLNELVGAIKRGKSSRKDSSRVSELLENKLRQKVLEYLNDVPDLSGYTPKNKMYNDKISKAIAKKTKDLLPQLLEDDDVKSQLCEDINDQLKDTLEDRGIDKSPKTTKKLAKDLLNYLLDAVKETQKDTLEKDLIKIIQDELKKTPQLSGDTPSSKRDNDNLSRDIAKKFLQVPSKNLDNKDVKDNLTKHINDQLNEALDNRGQREAPKVVKKLADNLFDKLKNAIQNEKEENLLENALRKKILESLNEVPELAGVSSATKRANDELSKDLATKMLEVPPEYIDNEDVIENLLEDINDQLNEALEKRGQRKDPKETKELAKDMLNELVGAIKRGKSSRKDSSRVSDPLENKLRQKVLEYLNDVPDLSGYTPSTKMYNDKISKAIAKKTKDSLPQLLEDDDVKNQLLEDINDQFKHTLEDRGIDKSPKIIDKMANDLLKYLGDTVKESQKNTLEQDLIKIVQDELKKTPQLSGDTPSSERDNDNLSRDIAKKFLQVPSKNLDNKDVKDNLTEDINDQLNEALDNRGQREAPKVVKKLADNLFDKLKNAIQNEKEENLLENALRKKILENLNEVPELAGVSSATKRANDELSKDLATKMLEVPPEYIDNEDVIENLLEDINDQLNEALEKRGQRKDPKETKELAKDMLNELVGAIKRGKSSRKGSSRVSDPLENKLRQKVLEYLNDVPDLSGCTPSNKMYNDKISKAIAKKTKDSLPQLLEDDDVKSQLCQDINDQLKDTLEDRGIDKSPKTTKKLAKDLLNYLVDTVKESQKNTLEQDLIKIVQDELKKTPRLSGDTLSSKRDNDNLSKDIAKKFLQVPSKNLDNKDVKDNLTKHINDQLNEALDNRGQREAPKVVKQLADNLFDKLKNAIQNEKEGNLLENALRKKILENLNEVPELAGVSSATKRANDELSKDLATKMLEVPPEYIDNEDVIDNLLEDINDQLNDALEKRGQRKDPKETKELAKDMLNELLGAIKRGKSSRKDSSRVSDPLENKLRQKVLEYLNDVPDLSGYTSSSKMYNDKISKAVAKKTKDLLPQLLEDNDVKSQLQEDINDQLKHTLEDRGLDKSPKILKKMASDLLNNLVNAVKESQEGIVTDLEKDLRKIVQDELENTPQLSGDTPSCKKDNDNLSKDVAKKFLQVPPENLDNDDVKHNLIKKINDELNDALEKRGQRKAPTAMKKLADILFDKLKNTIHEQKDIDPLENVLREKILESLKEVPELASDSFGTLRDNDKFSRDLAKKLIEVSPEDINNNDVKDNLLEYINDELNEALKKRHHHKDPGEIKKLAKDMLNKVVDAIEKGRKDVSAEPTNLRIWSWYKDIPELLVGDIAENKKSVENFANNLQKIRDEGGSDRQIEDQIEKWLDDTSKKKRVKFSEKEKDKLKNTIFSSMKANSKRSCDEPEETKKIVWNWFNNIPEIAVGDPSANKELTDRLADKLVSLKDEGGDTDQKMLDAIDDWLHKTSNKKSVHFSDPQKAKMRRNLMDSLKSAQIPSSSLEDDNETKRKVCDWFKDIPILSEGDNDKNMKLVEGLANKLKKIQDDGKDENYRQKIKDATDDWLEDTSNKKGVKLNKKQKEKLINKLADVFKFIPLQKSPTTSAHDDEKPSGPLWDWFEDIPELSGNKLENKLNVDELDKKLKKIGDRILDTDAAEEIEDAIEDWLEDMADKKNVKMYSKERKQLRKKLIDALYPNYSSRLTSNSDEEITQKVWEWFTDIPEISGGDQMKNKKLIKKLDDKLKKIHNENLDEEIAKHKMQGSIDNWLQDVALIKGEKLNTRIKEELRNKLMISLRTRSLGKRKKSRSSSHNFERFHNGPLIRDWFNNIPKLSNGNQSNDKHVDGLIKRVQKIENADGDKEQNNIKLKRYIDSWLRGMAKKNDANINTKEIESHRNNLMDALKPKTEKQKIQEWFENISRLCDDNEVENKKLIDDMAKRIEKIHEKNYGNGEIANKIKNEVDTWIKTVSKKKKTSLNLEEVEALKKTLLDSSTNKPSLSISDVTNSDTLDKITNSESLESDKDTDDSNSTSNKQKHEATAKIINNLKANKAALKRFKDVSTDVDEDRQKISEWLKNIPGIKFDDESDSILIDKLSTKLKKLRKEGKLDNKKKMNEEVKNWLNDIYKKDGRKLDNITKEHLIKKLIDSVNSKESKNRNGNLSSDQSVDDNVQKMKQRASRSPEKSSPKTSYSYKGPEDEHTKNLDGERERQRSSSSYSKDRKRWNKEPDVRFSGHGNNNESPVRSIESPLNKYDTDTIMSEDEDTASYKSPTLSIKNLELGSPSSASRGSQLDSKSSPTKPTPEKDLRQLIIGAGIEPKIMPESSYHSPNKSKQNPTIKERQKSKGSILGLSPKRKTSILKDTRHSDIPFTTSETSLRQNPRLRARSDVASRKLIEKSIMKHQSKNSKKKSPSKSNKSNTTGIYYVEESDSNEQKKRRKSVATQQPIQKSSKKSGEGENSTKNRLKLDKRTKTKISDFLAKNMDTISSPNYADVEEDIIFILTEDVDLPANEIRDLARMIIKRTRRNKGIEDSNDDEEKYELDSDSDNEDDLTDKIPRMMSKAKHLVRGVFDETFHFEEDPETQTQLEDAIVDLIADQLAQGDIDDPTKDAMLKLLHDANVPEQISNDICDKVMRRARERPMSFSEYRPPLSPRNRIQSTLTPNQKLSFLENAQREIADFYDELTDSVSAGSREIINEAIKDTVAKLADILDDPELTGKQKEDMMKNEIIRYLRKLPIQSNVPEEDLANQLMDRVQNIKFTSSTPEHSEVEGFHPRRENLDSSLSTIFDENELEANEIRFKDKIVNAIQNWSGNIDAIKEKVGFRDTMANDLANEIIDRQKYLQVNPDLKSSSEEELEHAKYIVFKWLNRMVNLDDLADSGIQIHNLVNAFSSIPVPKMAEQSKNVSLWALSRTSQGNMSFEDPLEADVAGWLQSVPKNEYARDDPYIQEHQIKQFVATMKKHKDKPNVEELAEEEINKWLPTMVNADQLVIDTRGNQLKNILKKNGFVNPPQGPETSQNKNTTSPKQPVESKVTLQQKLPAKSAISSHHPETQSKQPPLSKGLQLHGKSPQQTEQSQPSLVSRTSQNQQNPQSLLNLGLIPDTDKNNNKDTDGASHKFKKPVDVLYDVVDKWCKDLPIYSEKPNEDPEKTGALKQNISSKLIYKLGELNMNPEILNDDFLYEDVLLDEVDRQLKDVPKNPELDKYLAALKMELAAKIKDARQKIRDELAGQAYKQQLRDTMSTSICLPDNLSPDEQASFDILKDNLADAFINLHYVPDNPEDAKKFKTKINDEINRFCDEFLRRHPRLPVDRRKLTRDLYAALLSVPVPRDESMIHEVEQSRIKDIIDDWMKELPLRDETLTEQLLRNKTASLLAKRLHELENENASNTDLENEMFEEISKWLRKQHLRPGQEVYIPEFADRLKNKLKGTEHSRRFDLSARPLHQTQSRSGEACIGRIPPCTLSSEDRSHLNRIRERRGSPCSHEACPRVDSVVQDRPINPCSQDVIVYPRTNSYSQTAVKPKCSDRGSWCRKELCPGKTQTPTQTPGSYCSMRKKCDASCMTPTQSPYEISPNVIINEYYWDTTDGSKQTSFQQTQPPLQQPQGSHPSEYQTPQHSYHAPPPTDGQTPRQSFAQQAPKNCVPPGSHYTVPQPSTSSAYKQPSCECYQPTDEAIPCNPTPSRYNTRHRRCFRSPDASSGDENYPEPGPSRCRRVRVTRLGSLDDTSCQRKRRPEQKSRSRICDDDSEWSSVRFPEDGEFWDCPRHRFYGAREPFIQKEKREEKIKCKCKERVLTSCKGRNGRSYREYNTRHCDINCPHPSYMYFR